MLAIVLVGSGCSSDSDTTKRDPGDKSGHTGRSADGDGGTDDSAQPDGTAGGEDPTTATVGDDEFSAQMATIRADIEDAGDNLCSLSKALGTMPSDPANAGQMRLFADTYTLMLNNIARVLGPDTDHGNVVADAAGKFAARAAERDYNPDLIDDSEMFEIMNNEQVSLALVEFGQRAASCPGAG